MADELKAGDNVEWNSHGGKQSSKGRAEGTVEKKLTADTHIKSHTVRASPSDPQYLVKSDKSGREAAHKPEALRKTK